MENIMDTNKQAVSTTSASPVNGKHEPTIAELQARIAELDAKLAAKSSTRVTFQVTKAKKNAKGETVGTVGAISAYGMGRFPVTLYKSQWLALIKAIPDLQEFIKVHESELSVKE